MADALNKRMLDLQEELNAGIHPEWRTLNVPWLRLVATEGGRGLALLGPENEIDLPRLRACLVSIWHFILSEALVQNGDEAAAFLSRYPKTNLGWGFDGYATRCYDVVDLSMAEQWELLVGFAALGAPLYQIVMMFRTLMVAIGMSVEELHELHLRLSPSWWPQVKKIKSHCQLADKRS